MNNTIKEVTRAFLYPSTGVRESEETEDNNHICFQIINFELSFSPSKQFLTPSCCASIPHAPSPSAEHRWVYLALLGLPASKDFVLPVQKILYLPMLFNQVGRILALFPQIHLGP